MKGFLTKNHEFIIILIWGGICFAFFQALYSHHLFYQEQNQLFLLSDDYLATYFNKPAWLACMAGDFLTQFYYYLYAGPAILTLVLLTLGDLSRRGLQQAGVNRHFAFITAILVITIEAVFCLSVSYRLSSVLALCGGVIVFMFFKFACRDNKTWFAFSMIPSTAIAFWLFGYGLWALQILALVYFLLPCKRFKVSNWLVFFPCIAIPLIIYIGKNYYYLLPYL